MGKLALAFGAAAFAIGGVACLVPSFDDMGGDAKAEPTPRTNESDAATTPSASSSGAGASSSSGSSSSGGTSAPSDAGSDAKAPTFACGSSGLRCAAGSQTCCGVYASVEPVCRPALNPGECAGTLPCGDSADCGSGRVCCYRGNVANPGNGTCESSCSAPNAGTYAYRICDPQKPTCPGSSLCTGRFWGLAYCI